ncbi:MAG: 4-hydroxy-tetrahydrodipicolinate reductase [Kiritimatiellia bacterium]
MKVAILGAAGRMGQALVRGCAAVEGVKLAVAVEKGGCPWIGRDAGQPAGIGDTGVLIASDLRAVLAAADVAIDFTFHAAVPENAELCAALGKPVIIGTTGLDAAETARVTQAAARVPIVWAPNYSLGVNLLFSLVRRAAQTLGPAYDIEIVEMHHHFKKDAPSGTALGLAKAAAAGRGQSLDAVANYGRHGQTGERPRGEIGIHALRGGDVVGDHTVMFAAEGDRVELTHKASGRDGFAHGALQAAKWTAGRKAGLYDMQDVLGLK